MVGHYPSVRWKKKRAEKKNQGVLFKSGGDRSPQPPADFRSLAGIYTLMWLLVSPTIDVGPVSLSQIAIEERLITLFIAEIERRGGTTVFNHTPRGPVQM